MQYCADRTGCTAPTAAGSRSTTVALRPSCTVCSSTTRVSAKEKALASLERDRALSEVISHLVAV